MEEGTEGPQGTSAQRCRNDVATMSQRCRNDVAHKTPRSPPLQGQRSVSAPPRTAAKAEQPGEALKNCLDAVSTAFTACDVPPPSCYFFSNGSLLSSDSYWLGSSLTLALRSSTACISLATERYQRKISAGPIRITSTNIRRVMHVMRYGRRRRRRHRQRGQQPPKGAARRLARPRSDSTEAECRLKKHPGKRSNVLRPRWIFAERERTSSQR